jgi:hypothetical protein
MTARDRLMVMVIGALAVLGAVWFTAVSPQRKEASTLQTRVDAASSQLSTAESDLANARSAEGRYSAAYASIVSLGKAVPPSQELPSLIYQLDQASNHKQVEFSSVVSGTATGSGGASSGSAASGTPAATSAPTAFTQLPFTFVFNGSFFDLHDLFQQLNQFTERTPSGVLRISGRLLTIQGVKLVQAAEGSTGSKKRQLSGTITASAYVLPASQGLTAGATPAAPAGVGAPASSSSSSSPTTPAIARVTP